MHLPLLCRSKAYQFANIQQGVGTALQRNQSHCALRSLISPPYVDPYTGLNLTLTGLKMQDPQATPRHPGKRWRTLGTLKL